MARLSFWRTVMRYVLTGIVVLATAVSAQQPNPRQ